MIKQLFKQIWALRLSNIWLWAELFIISVCLWYVVNYLYVTTYLYFLPLGFDIENTYQVKLETLFPDSDKYDESQDTDERKIENFLSVMERIETYPGVESVCLTDYNTLYGMGYSSGMKHIDTVEVHGNIRCVSPEYFRVFKIKSKHGEIEPLVKAAKQPNSYIVSLEGERRFLEKGIDPMNQPIRNWGQETADHTLREITGDFRPDRFQPHYPTYFEPASLASLIKRHGTGSILSFRVSPEMDTPDFARRFHETMTQQLRIGNYYLLDISSYSDNRETYYQTGGQINELKTRLAILIFLLINIFMGITGTFWVRTQQRRAEIGLRMALGASKREIKKSTIGEGILLFSMIILPAAGLAYYLEKTEIIFDYRYPFSIEKFILVFSVTCLIIISMIVPGIYFPVKQALKVNPADVLHEE